jgi:hypothetical protein
MGKLACIHTAAPCAAASERLIQFFYDSFTKRPDDNRPTVLLSVQEIRPSPAGMPESSGD